MWGQGSVGKHGSVRTYRGDLRLNKQSYYCSHYSLLKLREYAFYGERLGRRSGVFQKRPRSIPPWLAAYSLSPPIPHLMGNQHDLPGKVDADEAMQPAKQPPVRQFAMERSIVNPHKLIDVKSLEGDDGPQFVVTEGRTMGGIVEEVGRVVGVGSGQKQKSFRTKHVVHLAQQLPCFVEGHVFDHLEGKDKVEAPLDISKVVVVLGQTPVDIHALVLEAGVPLAKQIADAPVASPDFKN